MVQEVLKKGMCVFLKRVALQTGEVWFPAQKCLLIYRMKIKFFKLLMEILMIFSSGLQVVLFQSGWLRTETKVFSSTEAAPICYRFCLGGQIPISERGMLRGSGYFLQGFTMTDDKGEGSGELWESWGSVWESLRVCGG